MLSPPPRSGRYPSCAHPQIFCSAGPQRPRFGGQNSTFASFMAGAVPRGGFGAPSPRLAVIKSAKAGPCPFPKQGDVDTYPSHPMALPGLPSQEASGRDRSAPNTRWPVHFRSGFSKAVQRFNAGWSSPVARQAHNLKVIGSNPIPATSQQALENTRFSRAFCCARFWSEIWFVEASWKR
jgi:hypothetical protein